MDEKMIKETFEMINPLYISEGGFQWLYFDKLVLGMLTCIESLRALFQTDR